MKTNQLVTIHDHQAITTSNAIADHFGKRHNHVIAAIRRISEQCPEEFNQPNFRSVEFVDAKGENRLAYELTRDAFTLVAMSFTGEKALQFKLAYIAAFNAMEARLKEQSEQKLYANLDHAHQHEELLASQVSELKDELLNAYRYQAKLTRIKKPAPRPLTLHDKISMFVMARDGLSKNAIAKNLGRSSSTVRSVLKKMKAQGLDPNFKSLRQLSLID